MLNAIAHDTVNDVATFQTNEGFVVRYGLQVTNHATLKDAMDEFACCQAHALECAGFLPYAA